MRKDATSLQRGVYASTLRVPHRFSRAAPVRLHGVCVALAERHREVAVCLCVENTRYPKKWEGGRTCYIVLLMRGGSIIAEFSATNEQPQ